MFPSWKIEEIHTHTCTLTGPAIAWTSRRRPGWSKLKWVDVNQISTGLVLDMSFGIEQQPDSQYCLSNFALNSTSTRQTSDEIRPLHPGWLPIYSEPSSLPVSGDRAVYTHHIMFGGCMGHQIHESQPFSRPGSCNEDMIYP